MITTIKKQDYKKCLGYIEKYWKEITCYHPKDQFIHLGLPHKFVVPSKGIYKKDQFYWDTYFTIVGLVKCDRTELAKGMVENFHYLFERFKIIPMRNRYYNIGISQIPFFTSMLLEVYESKSNKKWLQKMVLTAEAELKSYWMNPTLTEKHIVFKDLSRYCDHYITHLGAEHESGWDMTSRFHNHCLDYLPIDLNVCLYKYETDIARIYQLCDNRRKENIYLKSAEKRRQTIVQLMWNEKKGFFFDYNFKLKKQSSFYSVAGFYPLWANLATLSQATKVRDSLIEFEYNGGLVNTQSQSLSDEFKQHDYPNGWAPQHWIVVKGLLNYGFKEDAKRIAKKWLDLNTSIFKKTGKLWEKYDVVKCKVGRNNADRYPTQSGFGWTNAVFVRLIEELGE
ncbi:MAG: trehalase family glycosidase [Saprospiraceae bacterium]